MHGVTHRRLTKSNFLLPTLAVVPGIDNVDQYKATDRWSLRINGQTNELAVLFAAEHASIIQASNDNDPVPIPGLRRHCPNGLLHLVVCSRWRQRDPSEEDVSSS